MYIIITYIIVYINIILLNKYKKYIINICIITLINYYNYILLIPKRKEKIVLKQYLTMI